MQGHETFKSAVHRMSESTRRGARRAPASSSTTSTCSSTTRPTRASSRPWASGSDLEPIASIDCIDRYGNTSSATLPIALADAHERGRLDPGTNVLLAAFGAGFTWGAGVIQWGAPEWTSGWLRARDRRIARHRRGDRQRAGRGGLARGRELPQRRGRRRTPWSTRSTQAGGRARRSHGDVSDPATADALFSALEEEFGPVLVLVNNAGVRADGLSPQIDDDDWDRVMDTNLSGRLPAHPPRAAADDPHPLRAGGEHRVDRRRRRANAGPGQLRGLQGRPGRR